MKFSVIFSSAIFLVFIAYACFMKEFLAAFAGLLLMFLYLMQIRTIEILEMRKNGKK